MTMEMQQMLEREMDDALAIENAACRESAVQTVTLHYLCALTDCQRKTSERVKELVSEREVRIKHLQAVNWIGRAVMGFAAAGGFTLMVKLMKVAGVL